MDKDLEPYLPDMDQNSNKLPEREFFYGVLGTVKTDYLVQVIEDANKARYKAENKKKENDVILVKD